MVVSVANEHHERMDGNGYPNGLHGGQISLAARIVSIVDAFDAMTSVRPYRKGMALEEALSRIEAGAGPEFDADLAAHMCELGHAGDLVHIVRHTADGIPAVECPHCGPVIAVPRTTRAGDTIYCRACHSHLELQRSGDTFKATTIGRCDDPRNLQPSVNIEAVESVLAQIG